MKLWNFKHRTTNSSQGYILIFFSTLLFLILVLLILVILDFSEKPAPRFTPNFALNEKVRWLKVNGGNCDILVIGSSMALGNIDGPHIKSALPNRSILNTGAWGLSLMDTLNLLQIIAPICKPKLIVLVMAQSDFSHSNTVQDWSQISRYLNHKRLEPEFSYIYNMDGLYYLTSFLDRIGKKEMGNKIYDSLNFDETGGVVLDSTGLEIDYKKWNGFLNEAPLTKINMDNGFKSLLKISGIASHCGSQLLIITTPIRRAAWKIQLENKIFQLWSDVSLWSMIHNVTYVNDSQSLDFDDSYFADYMHLNNKGARALTEDLLPTIQRLLLR